MKASGIALSMPTSFVRSRSTSWPSAHVGTLIMTTLTMNSAAESYELTTTCAEPVQRRTDRAMGLAGASNVLEFVAFLEQVHQAALPRNTVDIDELVAEFERDDEGRQSIADGRRWVAERHYSEGPPSLQALRLRLGLSQAQLANVIGTSQPHIARLESGQANAKLATLRRLADVLRVDMNTIDAAMRR